MLHLSESSLRRRFLILALETGSMNVSMSSAARSMASRVSESDPVSAPRPATAFQNQTELPEFHGGNFGVQRVETDEIYATNAEIEIRPVAFNGFLSNAQCIGNPDTADQHQKCQPFGVTGACPICYQITVRGSWNQFQTAQTDWETLGGTEVGVNTATHPLTVTGPTQPGTYTLDVTMELASGTSQTGSITIEVVESDCTGDDQCPSDQICSGGVCVTPGKTCQSDADCGQGFVCENGDCVEAPDGPVSGDGFLANLVGNLDLGDPVTQALAAIAPGLFIVLLILLVLPA